MTDDHQDYDPHFAQLSIGICKAIDDYAENGGVLVKEAVRAAVIEAVTLYVSEPRPDRQALRAEELCREIADHFAAGE